LFGYEKGAFTGADHTKRGRFEMAQGGTIFLDEIGDISLKTQVDLLRVLQQREVSRLGSESVIDVDVRILAATNRDLKAAIKKGDFREDLFYRLNVISIHVPPLRERKEDIPLLAKAFVKQQCVEMNKAMMKISTGAMRQLMDYHWPGNVRELENVIRRAVAIGQDEYIKPFDLPENIHNGSYSGIHSTDLMGSDSLAAYETAAIRNALAKCEGHRKRAAQMLGIGEATLYRKLSKYQL
jgi:two-component system response regulator HydG